MQAGIDFNETFAPVPVVTTIRTLIAIGTKYDWEMLQGDVETAFLASDMDAEIYVVSRKFFQKIPIPMLWEVLTTACSRGCQAFRKVLDCFTARATRP